MISADGLAHKDHLNGVMNIFASQFGVHRSRHIQRKMVISQVCGFFPFKHQTWGIGAVEKGIFISRNGEIVTYLAFNFPHYINLLYIVISYHDNII